MPRLGFTLLKVTVGYGIGYRYFFALVWVALFFVLGWIALEKLSESDDPDSKPKRSWIFACSLDMLLPVVKLDKGHSAYIEKKEGFWRNYFYLHQIAGWVLASFLIAGLSGATRL